MSCGLLPICQEALILGEVSYYDYKGIVIDDEQKDSIIRALGPKKRVLFLRNHGVVCCGQTIEEAYYLTVNVMAACNTQVSIKRDSNNVSLLICPLVKETFPLNLPVFDAISCFKFFFIWQIKLTICHYFWRQCVNLYFSSRLSCLMKHIDPLHLSCTRLRIGEKKHQGKKRKRCSSWLKLWLNISWISNHGSNFLISIGILSLLKKIWAALISWKFDQTWWNSLLSRFRRWLQV